MQIKEKLFVLRKTRYGDSDLILNCLTSSGAKISLFARSALKSKKRFGGGVLEPTHYIQAIYDDKTSKRAEHPLHTLKEASLIQDFPGLRTEYTRIDLALSFVRLVSDIVREGDTESSDVFNLLGNTFRAAETTNHLQTLKLHFEIKLLASQGVFPVEADVERRFLAIPISDHESISISEEEARLLQSKIRRVLLDYVGERKSQSLHEQN